MCDTPSGPRTSRTAAGKNPIPVSKCKESGDWAYPREFTVELLRRENRKEVSNAAREREKQNVVSPLFPNTRRGNAF